MRHMQSVVLLVLTAILLGACTSTQSGDVYRRGEARVIQDVHFGTVEAVRSVTIEGTSGMVGTATGAAIGGIAGSGVGQGRGSAVAGIAGAVIGGIIGATAEEGVTKRPGLEITVRLEKGDRVISVVQESSEGETFRLGERVRVLTDGRETRVAH